MLRLLALSLCRLSLLSAVAILPLSRLCAADCYRIATAIGTGATGEIGIIAAAAFERARLCVSVSRLPPKRIYAMAKNGGLDGWAQAELPLDDQDPDFVRVPTALTEFSATLYWPQGRDAPQGERARIGVVGGQEWARQEIDRRHAQMVEVNDNKQLLSMVENSRLAGFMIPSVTYRHFLPHFPAIRGFRAEEVTSLPVTITLLRKHAGLVPALDRAVAGLRDEGFVAHILHDYESEFLGRDQR